MNLGTKIDLRDDKDVKFELSKHGECPVKKEEGEKLASKIKAHCYMECSALTQQGLHKVGILLDFYQGLSVHLPHCIVFYGCA